ncbi:hypothetical protein [Henriciella litoralis]|uniref:hypothetical protein n=1 Tax=Henriciella litoralis TaxID=568102 RepID=UPI0009FF75D3|nr:hypothetical protein [Henriciella litoralis]
MGGYGSGRHARGAGRSDQFHRRDLTDFPREWFQHRRTGTLTWSRGDHKTGSIGYRLSPNRLELHYTVTREGERQDITECFVMTPTEQPLGGQRWWIECRGCGRRCRVLFGGTYFRCRQCCRLTYESQYERIYAPGVTRAMRVRRKLKGEMGLAYPFPDRPKGMHWKTYNRLRKADWAAQMRIDALLMHDVRRLGRK